MTGTDHHIAGLGNLIEFTNYTGWSRFEGEPVTENGNFYDAKPQRGLWHFSCTPQRLKLIKPF